MLCLRQTYGANKCMCVTPCRTPMWVTISQPARQPASLAACVSHRVHLKDASNASCPGTRARERGAKEKGREGKKERSIVPPTAIDQQSVRRGWSIRLHTQPLSNWQGPNSQSQQTDEWYDKRMGPQMCLGPLISTRLIIRSADIWVAERANCQRAGWMEPLLLSHTDLCLSGGSAVVTQSPEETWCLLGFLWSTKLA